ncbi:hypothetical protein ORJ04_01600 [Rheinheimera baltica]|uniref:Uncharacterized protein n=1 Tax=Rheinheimera baltica TaxID=67576 RepID=A0ABT9HUG9_9GAMM|nr:hypothetical protein [Rheinheimera baltica]MDP5134643.1 hypothetical protein [Rheinheimera baltica]
MQDQQYNGVVLEDKWGKTYLCSSCLLARADLGDDCLPDVRDREFGRYFLHDLEPSGTLRQLWVDMYQHAKPWVHDLSKLNDFQLRDALLQLFAADEIRIWQLSDGWGQPPKGNGIGDGGLVPASGSSAGPAPVAKTAKPKGGGVATDAPVAAKAASHEAKSPSAKTPASSPQSLEDCEALLKKAADDLAINGYVPKYSDAELRTMAAAGTLPNDRFMVRFSPSADSIDAPIGHMRSSGRHPLWMSTFDMIERADTDPALIADLFGTKYNPNKEYTLYIVDRGENYLTDGSDTFVPTFDNMQSKLKDEFSGDIKPELIEQVMTAEYSEEFRAHWAAFNKDVVGNGQDWRDTFETKEAERFASEYFTDPVEQDKFIARQKILSEIGAWEVFTGDGLTERYSQKGSPGALEVLEIQHKPESLRELESRKSVKAIKLSGK